MRNVAAYTKTLLVIISILLFLGLMTSCSKRQESLENKTIEIPLCRDCNVILISLDTLRADHLGLYGYHRNTSPTIDALANESVVFLNAFANAYYTLPSHMSLITGESPLRHGINTPILDQEIDEQKTLSEDIPTMAETLHANGFMTSRFSISDAYVDPLRGSARGFDMLYPATFIPEHGLDKQLTLRAREASKNRKFFWHIHSYVNHDPYLYPEPHNSKFINRGQLGAIPYRKEELFLKVMLNLSAKIAENESFVKEKLAIGDDDLVNLGKITNSQNVTEYLNWLNSGNYRRINTVAKYFGSISQVYLNIPRSDPTDIHINAIRSQYDNGVYYADSMIAELIHFLEEGGVWNNTILVITSEHGEQLYEHGGFSHSRFYDEIIHVPLIIRIPGVVGERRDDLAQTIDILPTLLDVLGIEESTNTEGKSLFSSDKNEFVFGYSLGDKYIRSSKWKYIERWNGSAELYFIEEDSFELNNKIDEKNSKAIAALRSLRDNLQEWVFGQTK